MHYDDNRANDFATGDAIGPRDPDELKVALERVSFPDEKLDLLLSTELHYFNDDEWYHTVESTFVMQGESGAGSTWTTVFGVIGAEPHEVLEPVREKIGEADNTYAALAALSNAAIEHQCDREFERATARMRGVRA